jgi:hypothetical protein
MRETAWAIEIEPENYQAIISEGGKEITREFLERWLAAYPGGGYFVRDVERRRYDCTLMSVDNFFTLYQFIPRNYCDKPEICNGAHFRAIDENKMGLPKAS